MCEKTRSSTGLVWPLNEISMRTNGSLEDIWGRQNNMDTLQYDTIKNKWKSYSFIFLFNIKSFTEAVMFLRVSLKSCSWTCTNNWLESVSVFSANEIIFTTLKFSKMHFYIIRIPQYMNIHEYMWSPVLGCVHWRLSVSIPHLCMLNFGPGLKIWFSVITVHFQSWMWKKTAF